MKSRKFLISTFGLVVFGIGVLYTLFSCTKPADYMYYHSAAGEKHSLTKKVVDITGNGNVDIFWLIGGMTEQYANFSNGINQFMTSFVSKNLNWRMEVVCDNTDDQPYLGAPSVFDNNSANPVNQMVSAVSGAVNGNDQEQIFDPLMQNLTNFPNFIRPAATLVVIITNDDYEHSRNNIYANDVLKQLLAMKNNDPSKLIVYGVFGSVDLNCNVSTIDSDWKYTGSEFEKLVNLTGGKTYSLCDNSFGAQLAKLGDNLYQRLENPKLTLTSRPDPRSLHVFYQGKELPGGPKADGGLWYFDVNSNAIVFYDLTFVQTGFDDVTIEYTDQVDET
jgi:hypothetical protein